MMKRVVLGLAAFALASAIGLAEAQENKRLPATQANTEQKAKFVRNLVTNSQASRTIEGSSNEASKASLKQARDLVGEADKDIVGGKFDSADEKLNKALDLVQTETRKLSDGSGVAKSGKDAYDKRLATVKSMMEAQSRVAKEKSLTGNVASKREAITKYMEEADAYAKLGRYDQANVTLDKAYAVVTQDVTSMRSGDKLVKDLKFDTPHDEYVYEIDRNDSHFMLLRLQLSEKPPMAGYAEQIEALRREADAMRKQAEGEGTTKNYPAAIKTLGDSTQKLIRALRMAGAYIPG
jgi:hypothetical protein